MPFRVSSRRESIRRGEARHGRMDVSSRAGCCPWLAATVGPVVPARRAISGPSPPGLSPACRPIPHPPRGAAATEPALPAWPAPQGQALAGWQRRSVTRMRSRTPCGAARAHCRQRTARGSSARVRDLLRRRAGTGQRSLSTRRSNVAWSLHRGARRTEPPDERTGPRPLRPRPHALSSFPLGVVAADALHPRVRRPSGRRGAEAR